MSKIYPKIIAGLSDQPVQDVRIGLHWTAVVVRKPGGGLQCGLASTLAEEHHHTGEPVIPAPGSLQQSTGIELARWIESDIPLRRSVGCAAINALLERQPILWVDQNAEAEILSRGEGKRVVLIGHFPFVKRLHNQLEHFTVIELNPIGEDLPADKGWEYLHKADVVAITGMTFLNHTLDGILSAIKPAAYVMLLGPSTPLSPLMHSYGIDVLAGSIVEDIPGVLAAVGQGANFRQVHQAGVRLITQTEAHPAE